ncbi:sodium:solute symporter family protein [Aminiphilus sp.]|jgi:SSS family solute:Na+ symporter|uniref:sodium:solute symporter family protein n=1 Tax=Aminiphilus sp. TaxID=1872488 RepID=UPI002619DF4F|nr:sodium:solute symporter family protein [Aminiphilus sp.]
MHVSNYLFIIFVYLIFVAVYGLFIAKRRISTTDDFVTAGRKLPLWVLIGTLIATWYGGGGITGTANLVYTKGPLAGLLFEFASPLAIIIIYFIAARIRSNKNITIPELFGEKYGSAARILAVVFIVLAYVGICSYQFKGAGYVMNLVTGISVESGTILAAVVIIVLSASGGLLTVAYTDAISAIFIFLSLLLAVPILLYETGGMSGLITQLPVEKLSLWGGYKPLDTIGYVIAMLFLTLGDQNMFSRLGAAVNENVARISALGFIVGSILLSCLNVFVATVAIPYLPGIKPDTAFLMVAMNMLPFAVGGCVLAAAIAFMITTGDSFLLSSATSIYNDIIKKHSRRTFTEMQIFFIMRGLIVLLGVFSYLLITKFSDILGMMMYAYTIYGAAITPALLAALCWKKVTPAGGLSSILTGGIVTLAWELGLKSHFGEIDSALVAIPLSILVLIGVSLFTRKSCEGVSCESAS